MLLATWNVGSLEARLPRVLDLLDRHRPDVVLLQETRTAAGTAPPGALTAAGYTVVGHGAGRWTGVALLAGPGRALLDVRAGLAGEPRPEEARWLEATVAGLRVVSVDVPDGRAAGSAAFDEKLAFLDAAAARIAELRNRPLVVAGDFKVARADLDVEDLDGLEAGGTGATGATQATQATRASRATGATQAERECLRRLLGGGLVDAWRDLHPREPGYTWWDDRAGPVGEPFQGGSGMRVDLALVARQLGPRLLDCQLDCRYRTGPRPSDHVPVLVTLRG
jgi:exodeoxyribonuclease III